MTKQESFWIADHGGAKAVVPSAADRDYWVQVQGWVETTEPVGLEFQHVQHAEHGGRGVLAHDAAVLHEELGWRPSGPPPVPGSPEPGPALKSSPAKTATSGDKKE
jgi:hypothetical protein